MLKLCSESPIRNLASSESSKPLRSRPPARLLKMSYALKKPPKLKQAPLPQLKPSRMKLKLIPLMNPPPLQKRKKLKTYLK